jgi:hypothetical protein
MKRSIDLGKCGGGSRAHEADPHGSRQRARSAIRA